MASPQRTNPFYALLVVAGTLFTVTACAYGVMAFREVHQGALAAEDSSGGLLATLDRYGLWLLGGELVVLAIATVGAIATDRADD